MSVKRKEGIPVEVIFWQFDNLNLTQHESTLSFYPEDFFFSKYREEEKHEILPPLSKIRGKLYIETEEYGGRQNM